MRWRYLVLGVVLVGAVFSARQLAATSAMLAEPTPTTCGPDACPTEAPPPTRVVVPVTPDLTPPPVRETPGPTGTLRPTPAPSGAMALDCDANTTGIQTSCAYEVGTTFRAQVHVTEPSTGGYFAFQTKVRWDEALMDYLPSADPADEALWLECDIAARSDNTAGLPDRPIEPSVLFACIPFPVLSEGNTFTGAVLEFAFECLGPGSASLTLVPRAGDLQQGSHFLSPGDTIEPALADAAVVCVESTDAAAEVGASSVAGAEVSALPQSGARLAAPEAGPWSELAFALAAVGVLAASVGALRLRGRERS